jgi:hypothetical protein
VSTVHGPTFARVQGRASENGTWNAGAVGPWTAPMQSPRVRDATMTVSVPFTGRVAYRTSVLRRNCRQEYSSLRFYPGPAIFGVFPMCGKIDLLKRYFSSFKNRTRQLHASLLNCVAP